MRVLLLLLDDEDFRGSRRALVRALIARGDEVFVMARLGHAPLGDGAIAVSWSLARGSVHPLREARALAQVVRKYRRLRPDLVHHVSHKAILYGGVGAALCRVPSVNTITGLGYLSMSARARDRVLYRGLLAAMRVVLARRDVRVIFQNRDDRAALIGRGVVPAERAELVRGSGVDVVRFAPIASASTGEGGPPIVVCIGRLLREKGVATFREAALRLRARGVAARLVLVGEPDPANPGSIDAGELASWVRDGAIEWWGRQGDMPGVLARAAIVCVPSWGEGLPKVLLEAAAAGRPIVTTDAPGCREVVRDGVEGIVVPARDSGALADAIEALLAAAPETRAALGRRARARVMRELTDEHVVAATLAVYDTLLSSARPGPVRRALFAANAIARRFVYRSPRVARALWDARVAPVDDVSLWELGTLAVARTLRRDLCDGMRALEIGTGPYAILSIWAAARWRLALTATEIDPSWAAAAARAVAANRAAVDVRCCDLFDGLDGRFDAIWFVPPFTAAATVRAQAIDERARGRTCGGERGWETIDRFLGGAGTRLAPGGRAFLVVNRVHQAPATIRELVRARGLDLVREDRWLPYVTFVIARRDH